MTLTIRDQEEQDTRIDLMQSQKQLADTQYRWEVAKALAAILAGCALFMGAVLAVANYLHRYDQPMFPPGTVITIPAART